MIGRLITRVGVALLVTGALAAPASADTIAFLSSSLYQYGSVGLTFTTTIASLDQTAAIKTNWSAGADNAGGFAGYLNGATTPTLFFCDDLFDYLSTQATTSTPGVYTVSMVSGSGKLSSNAKTMTSTTSNALNALLSNGETFITAQSTTATKAAASAAVQVAVWALAYNGSSAAVTTTTNAFYLNSASDGTVITNANAFLTCAFGGTVSGICSGWSISSTQSVANYTLSGNQSVVGLAANTTTTTGSTGVPEPGSMLLLGGALFGLAGLRRRRG